jgi:hypothetical protein
MKTKNTNTCTLYSNKYLINMKKTITNFIFVMSCLALGAGFQSGVIGQQIDPSFDSRFSTPLKTKPQNQPAAKEAGNVIRSGDVSIAIMANEYLFPYGISPDGEHIVIAGFGEGGGYYYSQQGGLQSVPGTLYGISADALIAGSYDNPEILYNGNPVETAGTYDLAEASWTFLGMNPVAPNITIPDYNSGWGIDDAGLKVVGLQYVNGYSLYQAYAWTEAGGYEMLGTQHPLGSRASGVSRDGSLVFGWVQPPSASRSPAVWKDGQLYYVSENEFGEAYAASPNGTYAAGEAGTNAFIWSLSEGTEIVPNTLNPGVITPTIILEDKTMFGYTNEAWPPFPDSRRAFARYNDGTMVSFNDYAEARGMDDADEWIFFSVNAVTPDENQFIGAAQNPQGDWVSFLLSFQEATSVIEIIPESLTVSLDEGETSVQQLTIANNGTASLTYSAIVAYNEGSGWLSVAPAFGSVASGESIIANAAFDATGIESGIYTATIYFNSNDPNNPVVSIPVELTVNETCITPKNLEVVINQDNPNLIHLNWEHPEATLKAFQGYNIYKNGALFEELWPSNSLSYTEMQVNLHCFEITAVYSICGESDPSEEACADIQVHLFEPAPQKSFEVYPNPSSGVVYIVSDEPLTLLQFFDQAGQLIKEKRPTGLNMVAVDLQMYSNGFYVLRATTKENTMFHKIIISKY